MDPLKAFSQDELTHYIKSLLEQVEARLELNDYPACAWRLADALGAVSVMCDGPTVGLDTFTGLGYKLDVRSNGNPE